MKEINRSRLILHCGAHAVPRTELSKSPTPPATPTWSPIPHLVLLDFVEQALRAGGLRISGEAHGLSHEGDRYFGLLEVQADTPRPDSARVVGLRNSHDQRFSAGLVAGCGVMVCDNLSFSGEVKLSRKHTSGLLEDLPVLIPEAVNRLKKFWNAHEDRVRIYRGYALDQGLAHDLIIRAVDAGVCSNRLIPSVLEEWRHPRHQEFEPRTAWSLFNGFTEVLKGNVFELPRRTDRLHHLFDSEVGFSSKFSFAGKRDRNASLLS